MNGCFDSLQKYIFLNRNLSLYEAVQGYCNQTLVMDLSVLQSSQGTFYPD